MLAEIVLIVVFTLTLARTGLVLDAVCYHGGGGVIGRAAQSTRRIFSSRPTSHAPLASPRQHGHGPGHGAPKTRKIHALLVSMHVTALLAQGAGVLKYALPVSELSCSVTTKASLFLLLCYDANLVFFLVAKTRLTNGTRKLACWETVAIWWSRVYCWVYLYPIAIFLGLASSVNEQGTQCFRETTASNIRGYVTNNALLTVQFVILLALFVKPLLASQEGTQSGGAVYRRVVYRNVVCTASIVVATILTTVVTAQAMIKNSPDDAIQPRQVIDATPAVNSFVSLCLTEIALPLGFTSAWKSIFGQHPTQPHRHQVPTGAGSAKNMLIKTADGAPSRGSATSATGGAVVPVEAQP